jgi:hypothetical protein
MSKITITISGEFEEHELGAMIMLLRSFDNKHPDRHYELWIDDPDNSLAAAEALVRRVVPSLLGRQTKFTVHRKQ